MGRKHQSAFRSPPQQLFADTAGPLPVELAAVFLQKTYWVIN
jgi:hypothetical protein